MRTPFGVAAYRGPLTWDDTGWRSCPACEVEWRGDGRCFLHPEHPGRTGRLRSWCPHGLRLVSGGAGPLCPSCEQHGPADFTPDFVDMLALGADRMLAAANDEGGSRRASDQ